MKRTQKELVVSRREEWAAGVNVGLEYQGDAVHLEVPRHRWGLLGLRSIDSGVKGFSWERVRVEGEFPSGSSLRVYAYASDSKSYGLWPDLDRALRELSGEADELRRVVEEVYGPPAGRGPDILANRKGRYLFLLLEVMSSGASGPTIRGVRVWMEGDHMVDYLPALYQGDAFTRRYLSVFNSMVLDMEERIEEIPCLLDWETTGEEMLRYLSTWVCLDGSGSTAEELRRWGPTALDDYEGLYTAAGVRRSVRRLTGREPIIIEHPSVDPNAPTCIDPELYRRLYGDDPYRFFVLLEEDTFPSRDKIEEFLARMEGLIPAGMKLELVLLKRCVQLDWHTYLGVNSVVGSYVAAAIDENTTIHFDTMIGGQGE